MKALIADKLDPGALAGLASLGFEVLSDPSLDAETLPAAMLAHDPAIVVVRSTRVAAKGIEGTPALKLVIRAGAGYDNVDCEAATRAGVAVSNCPGMNADAVAELVFGFLICCDRRIPDQTADVRAGMWNKKEYAKARGLKGRTLGVIGVGAIGRAVITRAKAFGMRVVVNSINMTPERALDLGVEFGGNTREDLYRVLAECDAVSVHVAANDESKQLCDARFFDAMPAGSIFVNTSRGSVMDGAALERAVAEKGIRIGLDVFTNEPTTPEATWSCDGAEHRGVYFTHHVGASTEQAQLAVGEEVVRIASVWQETGRFENRVNQAAPGEAQTAQ